MSEANLMVGGGGGVPIRSVAWFPHGTHDDITINGERYLKSGLLETDTTKFDNTIWGDTRGLLWRPLADFSFGGQPCRVMDMESNGAGDILVAVTNQATGGGNPRVLRSTDGGVTWSVYALNLSGMADLGFQSIAFGVGRFVLVGDLGKIATSEDGMNYTLRTVPVNVGLFGIHYNGAIFVAVGQGCILTSTDGIAWVSRTVPVALSGVVITNVVFGNNTWMVTDQSGTIATAPADGSTWTLRATPSIGCNNLFFDSETARFYAYGGTRSMSTADGISWLLITNTEGPSGTSILGKMFKLGGYYYWADARTNTLVRSKDLKSHSPIYVASLIFGSATQPGSVNWAKRLLNGKLMLNHHIASSSNLTLHQGNNFLFAGSVLRVQHDSNNVSLRHHSLQGYSRIS